MKDVITQLINNLKNMEKIDQNEVVFSTEQEEDKQKESLEKINGKESMESVKQKIPAILSAIETLGTFYNPDNGWYSGDDGEGNATFNHWSGGLEELKNNLKRELTADELTLYSLSLMYGPTPSLNEGEAKLLNKNLWPEGNAGGTAMDLDYIKEKLSKLEE